ncbi:MAG: 6-hydroxymethylpterin diphosphokinase MptE-like protein, partial [Candidatus Heimdallarchaeaceae archaeon]
MILTPEEVLAQSKNAFNQWENIWREHAKRNGEWYRKLQTSHQDLLFCGIGKTLLCIGFAPSFEDKIDIIKKYKTDAIDIACVDKAYGVLLDNNIKPDFVFIADAGISYERWCEPWVEKTYDITLIANITSNPKWVENWRGPIYFYV